MKQQIKLHVDKITRLCTNVTYLTQSKSSVLNSAMTFLKAVSLSSKLHSLGSSGLQIRIHRDDVCNTEAAP